MKRKRKEKENEHIDEWMIPARSPLSHWFLKYLLVTRTETPENVGILLLIGEGEPVKRKDGTDITPFKKINYMNRCKNGPGTS